MYFLNQSEMMSQMLGGISSVMPSQLMSSMASGGMPDMSAMPPEVMMRMMDMQMQMQGGGGASGPGPPGGWGEGLGPNGGLGGGPRPGESVPNASAIRLYEPGETSTESVTLNELWEGGAIVCLAFGSGSCNMFRESQREYETLARQMASNSRSVRFYTCYISEAHPKDGWSLPQNPPR